MRLAGPIGIDRTRCEPDRFSERSRVVNRRRRRRVGLKSGTGDILGRRSDTRGRVTAVKAIWNGVTIADSDETIVVEGNHYFPPHAVRPEHLSKTRMRTLCPWKGLASYYSVESGGQENRYAAWSYPHIRGPGSGRSAITSRSRTAWMCGRSGGRSDAYATRELLEQDIERFVLAEG